MVRQGKKATHKCSRAEGGFSGTSKTHGPVSKPNSVGCYRQLNSSSLHKHTRRNPLSGDVCSPMEDHDVVPSLPGNIKSQTHFSSQNAWDIDALKISWSGLTAYAYPPRGLLHRVIKKIRQSTCLIIVITPGWPGMPWFWDLVQLSTEIPLQLPVSKNSNSPTIMCSTAIHSISTSTPGV